MQVKLKTGMKFKFYVREGVCHDQTYCAEVLSDSVTVEWRDEFGAYKSVNYATWDAESCIRQGLWEVINEF